MVTKVEVIMWLSLIASAVAVELVGPSTVEGPSAPESCDSTEASLVVGTAAEPPSALGWTASTDNVDVVYGSVHAATHQVCQGLAPAGGWCRQLRVDYCDIEGPTSFQVELKHDMGAGPIQFDSLLIAILP